MTNRHKNDGTLLYIIQNNIIINGVIQGSFKWTNNLLLSE